MRLMLLGFICASGAALLLFAGCSGDSVGQASQDAESASVAETTSTVAGDASWGFVPPPTDTGDTTETGDSGPSTEDATSPPEDATSPSDDATSPPEDATSLLEDGTTPPEDAEPTVDPCETVVCDEPPAGFCEGNMAVSYDEGECVVTPTGATCAYAELTTLCSEDEDQLCNGGVCEGCTTDQQCNDALALSVKCVDDLTTQFLSWKCEEGTCDPVTETVTCEGSGTIGCAGDVIQSTLPACIVGVGCQEVVLEDTVDCAALGQVCLDLDEPGCVDPEDTCLTNEGCLSPPEDLCDEDTAISYPAQGDCTGAKDGEPGICVYLEELTPCAGDQICNDGVCESPPCLWDYEPLHFDPCSIEGSTGPLLLTAGGAYTYNTDDGTLTGPDAVDPATEVLTTLDPEVRLMIVDRLEISADTTLKVVGAMPLVVVSLDDIDIQGTVDVSSTLAQLGAGANPATCGSASGTGDPGTVSGKLAGGGGGGGGLGGNGGDGASPDGGGGFGGDNGVKIGPPANIRGGCGGGSGAKNGGGDGGGGGGALYLAAQNSISISGVLHAGGAGGEGGDGNVASRSGGGGGGSGGYLGLEAPTVTLALNAVLAANGGGGGGGTDITHAGNGADGPAKGAPAAAGGKGHGNGGSGGIGAISGAPDGGAGLAKSDTRGAGGAGGGLGFIIVNSPALIDQGAKLSGVAILP